jgi:hypothetical protein
MSLKSWFFKGLGEDRHMKVYLLELIDLFVGINTSNLDRQDCRKRLGFFDCAGWNPSTGTVVLRVMDLGVALMNKRVFSTGLTCNAD